MPEDPPAASSRRSLLPSLAKLPAAVLATLCGPQTTTQKIITCLRSATYEDSDEFRRLASDPREIRDLTLEQFKQFYLGRRPLSQFWRIAPSDWPYDENFVLKNVLLGGARVNIGAEGAAQYTICG